MTKSAPKIALSGSRDIPFDKLVPSQSNVRRIKAGLSIEALADDIARRTLLQSLNVRPVLDESGAETGQFEVPAGGRRYRALELLVKQKRLAKNAPVPCIVRAIDDGVCAEEDSHAENTFREQLHPLDQFRNMQMLVDKGWDVDGIAAHFMTTPAVVRQRLKLAAVSPVLHALYADDEMTLEQLIAFSVSDNHERQEQVWDGLANVWNKSPSFIRQKLTETSLRATDKRVRFVTVDAYVAAGGGIMRDLFEEDSGGWLTDPALLDRLLAEKLERERAAIQAEGWKWVDALVDRPWDVTRGVRQIHGVRETLSEEEQAKLDSLQAEIDRLESEWADAPEMPAEVSERLDAIDEAIGTLVDRPLVYDAEEMGRAGVFVSLDVDGSLRIERGFVRPADEPVTEADPYDSTRHNDGEASDQTASAAAATDDPRETDDNDGMKPLPEKLVAELTAWRTLALQDAISEHPTIAYLAMLHAVVLSTFYVSTRESCLELSLNRVSFGFAPGDLRDSAPAKAMVDRHEIWAEGLPDAEADVWNALLEFDETDRAALFAYCVSLAVNAQQEALPKYDNGRISRLGIERRIAHSHVLARATSLDVAGAGWRPTAEGYFRAVTKGRILADVTDARGERFAEMIANLKKGDMATEAENLLADTGWVPEPMRTPGIAITPLDSAPEDAQPAALTPEDNDNGDVAIAAE